METDGDQNEERPLPVHQRNLVDTWFEEGQYDAAITVLNDFRSPMFSPFPPHIRQLIYIALYPPPSIDEQAEEEATKVEPGSPSKLLSKRHKSSLAPDPKVTAAAMDLLMYYARTNRPESLAAALPSYPKEDSNVYPDSDEEESHIARQALLVRDARCCWDILKEGFIETCGNEPIHSPQKPQLRRTGRGARLEDDGDDDDAVVTPAPVSENGWAMLDWILTLFEHEEAVVEGFGLVRHSTLLLDQIPPSRGNSSARWDVEIPLDVAFHALAQENELRRNLGTRLLALLINLTSTTYVDLPMFLKALSTRTSSLSLNALSTLFDSLPATRAVAQFKVLLCSQSLRALVPTATGKPGKSKRARPRPRGRPRAESAVADDPGVANTSLEGDADADAAPNAVTGDTSYLTPRFPSIRPAEVLALLARPGKPEAGSVILEMCFKAELVLAYGALQLALAENGDGAWAGVVRDGSLRTSIEDALAAGRVANIAGDEGVRYAQARKESLLAIVDLWEQIV